MELNPFSVRRISRLPYVFESLEQAQQVEAGFAGAGFRGVIVGPHGCGKSTLAMHLARTFSRTFSDAISVTIRPTPVSNTIVPWTRLSISRESLGSSNPARDRPRLLLIDGVERLNWLQRNCLIRGLRKSGDAFVITTHRSPPFGLHRLAEVTYSEELALRVVDELQKCSTCPLSDHTVRMFVAEASSTRSLLMRLFDVYEEQRRNANG